MMNMYIVYIEWWFKSYEQRDLLKAVFYRIVTVRKPIPPECYSISVLHVDVRRSTRQSFKGSCNLSALVLVKWSGYTRMRTFSRWLYMFVQVIAFISATWFIHVYIWFEPLWACWRYWSYCGSNMFREAATEQLQGGCDLKSLSSFWSRTTLFPAILIFTKDSCPGLLVLGADIHADSCA